MEFPELGEHCSEESCKRLDFLPVKCDACTKIFCGNHMKYEDHNCSSAYKKNVQVPVCPLCNNPVPAPRGTLPDIVVSEHIDNDCQSDKASGRRKVFANKCSMKGCRTKEMVPVICPVCRKNYCFKHRHIQDHDCRNSRQQPKTCKEQNNNPNGTYRMINDNMVSAVHGSLSEDEALARALQASMSDSNSSGMRIRSNSQGNRLHNCSLS